MRIGSRCPLCDCISLSVKKWEQFLILSFRDRFKIIFNKIYTACSRREVTLLQYLIPYMYTPVAKICNPMYSPCDWLTLAQNIYAYNSQIRRPALAHHNRKGSFTKNLFICSQSSIFSCCFHQRALVKVFISPSILIFESSYLKRFRKFSEYNPATDRVPSLLQHIESHINLSFTFFTSR